MFSPIDTSQTFKMHFSWVLPVKKMTLLDVTSPVLSQPIFMQLVQKRIEALHNIASRTTWTRKIKPGQERRATSVTLITDSTTNVKDNSIVVIPFVFRCMDTQTCASQCIAFASFHVRRSRKHRRFVVHVSNVRKRGIRRRRFLQKEMIDFLRPHIERHIPKRFHGENLKFQFESYLSSGESKFGYVHE